ncbi:SANT/Myb_domain [Hexamita inflata]|uniref:SANT/Myb domain n=1 Tax=Hexamita inflata TaxID=28002 RepID=A0AA86NMD3_9EUKA|nr:SANT/Myb domain [Hexamita inflata]
MQRHVCNKQQTTGGWSYHEKQLFKQLYKTYKTAFSAYVPYFETRSESQIRSFYYNVLHFNKIEDQRKQASNKLKIQMKPDITETKKFDHSTDYDLFEFTFQSDNLL